MDIKTFKPIIEDKLHLENNKGEFDEAFVFNNKDIFYINWIYEETWSEETVATYLQPSESTLENKYVEILNIFDLDGNEKTISEEANKKIINFLRDLSYVN